MSYELFIFLLVCSFVKSYTFKEIAIGRRILIEVFIEKMFRDSFELIVVDIGNSMMDPFVKVDVVGFVK